MGSGVSPDRVWCSSADLRALLAATTPDPHHPHPPCSALGLPPDEAAVEAWGCARRRLLPAVRRPGVWLRVSFTTHPPTPRQGRLRPGGYGPAPSLASMADRRGFGSGAPWEVRSFRLLWLVGSSASPHHHPAGALGWPSIPAHLRFRHAPRAASPSSSLGSPALCCSGPGGLDLRSFPDLGLSGAPATVTSRCLSFRSAMQPCPPPELARPAAPGASFGVGRGSPSYSRSSGLYSTSSSPIRAPTAWDCSEFGQGEIPAFYAGSGDTCGCRPLLGGAAMAAICAPLRASGETLGPVFRIGRRRRLGVVLLREGVVLFARGVLGADFEDVGRLVVGRTVSLVGEFSCVFLCLGRASHVSLFRAPCSRLLRPCHVLYHLLYSF